MTPSTCVFISLQTKWRFYQALFPTVADPSGGDEGLGSRLLGLRLLRKNRARRSRSRKKACESVFGAALSLRSRSCRRVFCCPVSGAVDFLLSSSYFFWVAWNLVYQGQLVSWRASRPLFGPHGENFDFSTIVRDFVTVERYADTFASPCRVCWKFFSAPSRATAYLVLEFGVHRCGCLGVDVQSDSAEVHYYISFHRHSRWLYSQQQSSSSSSNRFIEHDVSTRKLGPSSGIPEEGPSFRVETSCSIKRLLEDEELCCWLYVYVRLSCLWKIFAGGAKVRGLALRNAGGQSSLDPHPGSSWKTMPCCKDVLPSIRQSTWSVVEKNLFLFDAAAESALAVQV